MSAISGKHVSIKKELIAALHEIAALAESVGMTTLAKELNGTRIPKLEDERFALVVLGEFNHGKSTFVNALCGAPILPAGITPTTATINHLNWAAEPTATAHLTDDTTRPIDPKKLGEWVTIEGKEASHVKYVEVGWPAEILKDKVTLVDTPGVNDINEQRAEITYGYIPRADAVLFLLDGAQVLKQSERSFLEQRILRRSKDKLIFILGKIDLLAPDEREEALKYCRDNLARIVDEPQIFPVSAKRQLSANDSERGASGFAPFLAHLQKYLASERGRVLLDNGIADGLRTGGYLGSNLGIKRRSLHLQLEELEERIARVHAQLSGVQSRLKVHHAKIRAEADAIKAGVRLDLEEFVKEWQVRLPAEIDRADGEEIKRYLGPFIQDTWKKWAEDEGEKVAAQLERLAEEIIAVTNEDVAAAMATLSRELGPADTKIDLEVDTLKYDVGVFALGALGTGIFLFVNTLVGGLLTLAAPILAVVFKERVAGEIKAQAKKNAPEVVSKAAAAVAPRFDAIVEDFAARLADFVTAAGDALHRGIGEVLDRALAERRAQGVDASQRAAELEAELQKLQAIEQRLESLRERLWGIFDRIDRIAEQLGDLIVPDDVRAHVELGAAYLDRGDLDAAINELSRALDLKPDHPRASYLLGVSYARRGDDDAAIASLERAAAMKRSNADRPGFAEAWLALGEVHKRRGDDDAAIDAYRAALDAGVGDSAARAEVYRGLGSVYLRQRRFDKAVRELRKAVAATPDDPETQGLLGRALYLRGDYDTARVCLERAAQAARPDPFGLVSLGDLFERLGRVSEAREAYLRALQRHAPIARPPTDSGDTTITISDSHIINSDTDITVAARLGLARLTLAQGDVQAAKIEALRALELDPARPDILTTLGRIHAAAGQLDEALQAYDRALVGGHARPGQLLLFDRRGVLEEALRTALKADAIARAHAYAQALLADHPTHADALAAEARQAVAENDLDGAQTFLERSLASEDGVEARLAAATIALARHQPTVAAAALRRAAQLAPLDPRPRAQLTQLYLSQPVETHDLYALLAHAHRLFARTPEFAELSPEAGRLVEVLDRPLLVTVMGEFNSGKSTFVNALIGEEVAPMGITPTTATINVLKYGAERKGRVVYRDGDAREIAWDEVPRLLKGLDADEAGRIRVVEVLYPLETLQRVNVVDTPGLNSIHPEHEATAQKFIAEADAVLWLFTVDQAAKATEGEALAKIKSAGKKILGVVNKIDRCAPDDLARIIAHVQAALGEHLETIVPFAAKEALAARKLDDKERLAKSNHAALQQALEERFFSRARAIKREAATARLAQLIGQARAIGHERLNARDVELVLRTRTTVRDEALRLEREHVPAERRALQDGADAVYAACAREVLDFVRPRRWPFGSNEAAPADRDFLIQLLDERLGALLDAARARTQAEVMRAVTAVRAVLPEARFDAELALLDEQVFGRFRAFVRGYLRGGRVDDFFVRVLPKLELSEPAIRRALERDAPWNDDVAEVELRAPLKLWARQFYAQLEARLARLQVTIELDRLEIEEKLIAPIEQLSTALSSIS